MPAPACRLWRTLLFAVCHAPRGDTHLSTILPKSPILPPPLLWWSHPNSSAVGYQVPIFHISDHGVSFLRFRVIHPHHGHFKWTSPYIPFAIFAITLLHPAHFISKPFNWSFSFFISLSPFRRNIELFIGSFRIY